MADNQHSLATYVSDMLALERHVREPFDSQTKDADFNAYNDASQLASRLSGLADGHVNALKSCLDTLGGQEASPIKSAVTEFEGAVASAIGKVRKTKVSKALRDDYTALALCSAGYTMLQTTAHAMRDANVAALAQRHLEDYARCLMEIGQALPAVVVQELRDLGLDVDESVVETSRQAAQQAWRGGSDRSAVSTGEIGATTIAPEHPSRSSMGLP
ncbi:MAG TPA: hypothetical protein VIG51_12820 [Candidatus Baltobacteraceae bacterium]